MKYFETQRAAAKYLNVSERHFRRLKKVYNITKIPNKGYSIPKLTAIKHYINKGKKQKNNDPKFKNLENKILDLQKEIVQLKTLTKFTKSYLPSQIDPVTEYFFLKSAIDNPSITTGDIKRIISFLQNVTSNDISALLEKYPDCTILTITLVTKLLYALEKHTHFEANYALQELHNQLTESLELFKIIA